MAGIFDIEQDVIRGLAELLRETDLTEIEVADGEKRLRLTRQPPPVMAAAPISVAPAAAPAAAPVAAAASAEPASEAGIGPDTPGAVTSPMVGTAYLAPEPNAANFVKIGDQVSEGQTLLIIEAMKVMNPIRAPKAGQVKEILVDNGQPVEFGEVLLVVA